MEVWFNPSCSKCRIARHQLDEAGVNTRCAATPTTRRARRNCGPALAALGRAPWDITRMFDPLAHELGLKDMARDADAWIRMLAEHPKLIQRPLVLTDVRGSPGTTRR